MTVFQLVGDGGEVGGGGRLCGLVGRLERAFGFLGAEVVESRPSTLVCRGCRSAGSRGLARLSGLLAQRDDAADSAAEDAVHNAGRSAPPAPCRDIEEQLRQQCHRLPLQIGSKRHAPRRQQAELSLPCQSPRGRREEPTVVSSNQTPAATPVPNRRPPEERSERAVNRTRRRRAGGEHLVAALACGPAESPLRADVSSRRRCDCGPSRIRHESRLHS